jgi:hypothetical protein
METKNKTQKLKDSLSEFNELYEERDINLNLSKREVYDILSALHTEWNVHFDADRKNSAKNISKLLEKFKEVKNKMNEEDN